MIDNIILLITGTLHQRQIAELRDKCHPLGSFEEMEQVNIAATPAELYEAVLVDTPLGKPVFPVSHDLLWLSHDTLSHMTCIISHMTFSAGHMIFPITYKYI